MKYFSITLVFVAISAYISAQNVNQPRVDMMFKSPIAPTATVKSEFEASLAVIDPLRVLEGSMEYRKGIENIEKELEARKKELQNLERDIIKKRSEFETAAAAMSEAGRKQRIEEATELQLKYQSKLQTAQQYAQGAEEELRAKILRKVQEVVAEIAKEMNFKVVLAGGILYAIPSIDITDKVVERLNKKFEAEQKKAKPVTPPTATTQPAEA